MTTAPVKNSKLEIAATSRAEDETDNSIATGPDPFNLASLRINLAFKEGANVKKVLNVIPVRRPKKQEWIRVHADEGYRGDFAVIKLEADGEFFIVAPAIAREFANAIELAGTKNDFAVWHGFTAGNKQVINDRQ